MLARTRTRPGFALAIALAAIVIIGAIITGMFFASTQEYRMSRNSALQARALTTAEYGMNFVLTSGSPAQGHWNPAWNTAGNGLLGTIGYAPGDGGTDTVRVTKVGDGLFQVTSTGRVGPATGAQARHRVGGLVTLSVPQLKMLGALTTQASVKIGGSSFLSGLDDTVPNWGCPPPSGGVPGLAMPDTTQITTAGCGGLSCIAGVPKVSQNVAAADTNTYFSFGAGLDWVTLSGMASKTYSSGSNLNGLSPSVSGTTCNTADPSNWGDPMHSTTQCQGYFPIIYAQGDLKITGGVGQGILLVSGDLSVQGGAEFFGPVIVRGSLKTAGTGGHFHGGVMAANVDLEQSSLLGNAEVSFSSCALQRALAGAATPMFVQRRSWTELY
jgi:Tfp pilus assembly protein PilV